MSWKRRLQLAVVVAAIIVYSGLSHYSNSHAQARDLATGLALVPMLALGCVVAWRSAGALLAAVAAGITAYLLYDHWPLLKQNFSLLYFVQQFGFYALMALSFGITLRKPRVPLCTMLADKVHGPLTPKELRYTRQVTAAWTLFFILNMLATLMLFELAPLRIWSVFVNFVSLPLVALMFAAEYLVRRRVLPQVHGGGILATLRVYFANPR
jgi:uncharacterized membrane protein